MIKVLIADDSAFMRKVLSDLFTGQPDFTVAGTAKNGKEAIELTKKLRPDLLTMDVNMPVMDGLNALAVIMEECPTPVVMLSSLTQEGTEATIRALSLGAVDFISKAGGSISRIDTIAEDILKKCRNAAQAHVHKSWRPGKAAPAPAAKKAPAPPTMHRIQLPLRHSQKMAPSAPPEKPAGNPLFRRQQEKAAASAAKAGKPLGQKLVAIGTSTGGPQALQTVITQLPADLPCGVVVVQHMPPGFTKALSDRLNSISAIKVKEAEDGDIIRRGQVYMAPGN